MCGISRAMRDFLFFFLLGGYSSNRNLFTPKHFSKTEDFSIGKFRCKDLKFYRVQVGPAALNKNFNKSLGKVKLMI